MPAASSNFVWRPSRLLQEGVLPSSLPARLDFVLIFGMQFLCPPLVIDALITDVMTGFEDVPTAATFEKGVHLFQGSSSCFRVHQDDEGETDNVEDEKE